MRYNSRNRAGACAPVSLQARDARLIFPRTHTSEEWLVFSEMFGRTCNGDDARSSIITDGQFSCCYAEAPTALKQIEIFLAEQGIDRDVCVAVECINSLAGALLILALFQRGNSFILTPSSRDAELKPTPHF